LLSNVARPVGHFPVVALHSKLELTKSVGQCSEAEDYRRVWTM
jgi:hypothetical protein